MFYVGNM